MTYDKVNHERRFVVGANAAQRRDRTRRPIPKSGPGAGPLIGLISGYIGGTPDLVIQRVVDAVMALPLPIFALAVPVLAHRRAQGALA